MSMLIHIAQIQGLMFVISMIHKSRGTSSFFFFFKVDTTHCVKAIKAFICNFTPRATNLSAKFATEYLTPSQFYRPNM
uniref:Putative secreted protein n=1 Tax=Ixodes ricinus TaxID=34613 RepID=A0A6B0U0G7_IXORI